MNRRDHESVVGLFEFASAVVSSDSGVRFAFPSCALSAMVKQPACAAAISSSGLVPIPFSNRRRKRILRIFQYAALLEIVPLPSFRPPRHTALAVRCIRLSFCCRLNWIKFLGPATAGCREARRSRKGAGHCLDHHMRFPARHRAPHSATPKFRPRLRSSFASRFGSLFHSPLSTRISTLNSLLRSSFACFSLAYDCAFMTAFTIGVDLGGTNLRVAAVTPQGESSTHYLPTRFTTAHRLSSMTWPGPFASSSRETRVSCWASAWAAPARLNCPLASSATCPIFRL